MPPARPTAPGTVTGQGPRTHRPFLGRPEAAGAWRGPGHPAGPCNGPPATPTGLLCQNLIAVGSGARVTGQSLLRACSHGSPNQAAPWTRRAGACGACWRSCGGSVTSESPSGQGARRTVGAAWGPLALPVLQGPAAPWDQGRLGAGPKHTPALPGQQSWVSLPGSPPAPENTPDGNHARCAMLSAPAGAANLLPSAGFHAPQQCGRGRESGGRAGPPAGRSSGQPEGSRGPGQGEAAPGHRVLTPLPAPPWTQQAPEGGALRGGEPHRLGDPSALAAQLPRVCRAPPSAPASQAPVTPEQEGTLWVRCEWAGRSPWLVPPVTAGPLIYCPCPFNGLPRARAARPSPAHAAPFG